MTVFRTAAPAKVNLGLFLGPRRSHDGKHELVTVMQSLTLVDTVTLGPAGGERDGDEVVCSGLPGPPEENLAARALELFRRASGWNAPPLRLEIEKRIPIAAGLAGGSTDAAATLRLAAAASGLETEGLLLELAGELGADVRAQLEPGRWLATGAGEAIAALPQPGGDLELLLLPFATGLSTAAVYTEADRLGLGRSEAELAALAGRLREALGGGASVPAESELVENDLQRAAISLVPAIEEALAQVSGAGARDAFVSGSGPTVVGVFAGPRAREGRERARELLRDRTPAVIACAPAAADAGAVRSHG